MGAARMPKATARRDKVFPGRKPAWPLPSSQRCHSGGRG
jgi:hypothetical protein